MASVHNARVNGSPNYFRAAPLFHDEDHQVRMVVVANAYVLSNTSLPACTLDGQNVEALAHACGVQTVETLFDDKCTREALLQVVEHTCSRCRPNDVCILYFAGYNADANGTNLGDGPCNAFACVDRGGMVCQDSWLVDTELSDVLLRCCSPDVRILILADCCPSMSFPDITGSRWDGRQAIAITGCRNTQVSSEVCGRGGLFTHALLLALAKLSRVGHEDYSVGACYNAIVREAEESFRAYQEVVIQFAPQFSPDRMAWPLVPPLGYEAPLYLLCADGASADSPDRLGVHPEITRYARPQNISAPVSVEEYINYVVGSDVVGVPQKGNFRDTRACCAPGSSGSCFSQ